MVDCWVLKKRSYVQLLVCAPAISARKWRYHRIIAGTILIFTKGTCLLQVERHLMDKASSASGVGRSGNANVRAYSVRVRVEGTLVLVPHR